MTPVKNQILAGLSKIFVNCKAHFLIVLVIANLLLTGTAGAAQIFFDSQNEVDYFNQNTEEDDSALELPDYFTTPSPILVIRQINLGIDSSIFQPSPFLIFSVIPRAPPYFRF